jgi:hypothetical protein
MGYAIMQKELVVPALEQLKRAFTVLPTLTELDAQTVANDAFGIIMRGLELDQATLLRDSLLVEQVETLIVEESSLPALPTAKIVRRVGFLADHLNVYDSMQRETEVPWREIMCIAAGLVRVRETHRVRELETVGGTRTKEEETPHLLLDLFLTGGAARYSITAADFSFDHPGGRSSEDLATNFVFLVQELARHAPHAGQNRGAFLACQKPPELFPYPSKQTFNEELTWMLWRIAQLQEGGRGEGVRE